MVHFTVHDPESHRKSLDLLSEDEKALLMELTLTSILCFYWCQDPSHPADADATFETFLPTFPEKQFMVTLHSRATQADVQLRAPTQEFFVTPRVGNSTYVDYAAIDSYIAQTANSFNISISNSDPEYRRIRDLASMQVIDKSPGRRDKKT